MGSSQGAIDNIVRSKRKIQNIAVISALSTCVLTVVLVATNYHIVALNKGELAQMVQQQQQIQIDADASADIQAELTKSKSEIKGLKVKLDAEKKNTQSLKKKLTDTLELLAQIRQTSDQKKVDDQSNLPSAASALPQNDLNKAGQPALDATDSGNADPQASAPDNTPSQEIPATASPQTSPNPEKGGTALIEAPVQKETGNRNETILEPKNAADEVSAGTKLEPSGTDQVIDGSIPKPKDPAQPSGSPMDDSVQ